MSPLAVQTLGLKKSAPAIALIISQTKRPAAPLGPQRPVLLTQVGQRVGLAPVEPAAQRDDEPTHQCRRIDHAGEDNSGLGPLMGHYGLVAPCTELHRIR